MKATDDDLIVFRRRSAHAGQWVSCDRPRVKLEVERGTFVIFKRVAGCYFFTCTLGPRKRERRWWSARRLARRWIG